MFFFYVGLIKMKCLLVSNKCAVMVVKPLNFVSYLGCEEPTFHLSIYSIPKESMYSYLGITLSNDLSLKPIITYMNTKILIFFC
jgi:hypothetical protein